MAISKPSLHPSEMLRMQEMAPFLKIFRGPRRTPDPTPKWARFARIPSLRSVNDSKRFGQNVLNFLEEKGPGAYNSYFLAETLQYPLLVKPGGYKEDQRGYEILFKDYHI